MAHNPRGCNPRSRVKDTKQLAIFSMMGKVGWEGKRPIFQRNSARSSQEKEEKPKTTDDTTSPTHN